MIIRFHPTLYIIILFLILSGNIAMYAMLLISLYIHEIGHLCFAKRMNERISSCKLMPYGGEIQFKSPYQIPAKSLLIIAIGGPIFTFGLLLILYILPTTMFDAMIHLQWIILSVNLLPFLPLDGGQVLLAFLTMQKGELVAQKWMYASSIVFFTLLIIIFYIYLPQTFLYMMLALFLCIQNIQRYHHMYYENAIRKIMKQKQYKI